MKIPIPPVEGVGSEWLDRSFGLSIMPSRRTRYVAHTDTQKRAIANSKCVTNTMVAIGIHLTEEANESGHIVETQDVPTQLTAYPARLVPDTVVVKVAQVNRVDIMSGSCKAAKENRND